MQGNNKLHALLSIEEYSVTPVRQFAQEYNRRTTTLKVTHSDKNRSIFPTNDK